MSASEVVGASLAQLAEDIETTRGQPLGRVLRYHGSGGLPEDKPTDAGVLSATIFYPSMPAPPRERMFPYIELVYRYSQCWPRPRREGTTLVLEDDAWDLRAAQLEEIAHAGVKSLMRYGSSCHTQGCDRFWFLTCTPTGPSGDAAGWVWRARATIRSRAAAAVSP